MATKLKRTVVDWTRRQAAILFNISTGMNANYQSLNRRCGCRAVATCFFLQIEVQTRWIHSNQPQDWSVGSDLRSYSICIQVTGGIVRLSIEDVCVCVLSIMATCFSWRIWMQTILRTQQSTSTNLMIGVLDRTRRQAIARLVMFSNEDVILEQMATFFFSRMIFRWMDNIQLPNLESRDDSESDETSSYNLFLLYIQLLVRLVRISIEDVVVEQWRLSFILEWYSMMNDEHTTTNLESRWEHSGSESD